MKIAGYKIERVKNAYIKKDDTQKIGSYTISVEPTQILPADIQTLKEALIAAKGRYTEDRVKLYDIYENAIQFDSILSSVIEQRLLATSGKAIQYVVNDQPSEAAQLVIESPKFQKLINELLFAVQFNGMGLFQFFKTKYGEQELFDFMQIPIKHVDPYQQVVRKFQAGTSKDDKPYAKDKTTVFVGDRENFGLLQIAVVDAIRKRDLMNNWSNYARLAGNNFERVIYRGGTLDPARRQSVVNALQAREARVMDFPEGIDYKVENMSSSQQNQLFKEFSDYLDKSMTRLILGQTMTTESGASRSQAEVHERTQETIFDADSKLILDLLNYELSDVMQMFGVTGGEWKFVENTSTKMMEQVEFDLKLKELGVVFTNEEIRAKYQI